MEADAHTGRAAAPNGNVPNLQEHRLRLAYEQRDVAVRNAEHLSIVNRLFKRITMAVDEEAILRTLLHGIGQLGFNRVHYFARTSNDELVPRSIVEYGTFQELEPDLLSILPANSALFAIIGEDPSEFFPGGVGDATQLDAPLHDVRGQYVMTAVQRPDFDSIGYLIADDYDHPDVDEEIAERVFDLGHTAGLAIAALRANAKIRELADTDHLTGVANRRRFVEELDGALARNMRGEAHFVGLAYFDLNDFKRVNDTEGHAAGDEMLRRFANALRDAVRSGDSIGRIGGDEFCVSIMARSIEEIDVATNRIRAQVRFAKLSTSIGIAVFPTDAPDAESLMRVADDRLFQDKRFRKGICVRPALSPIAAHHCGGHHWTSGGL